MPRSIHGLDCGGRTTEVTINSGVAVKALPPSTDRNITFQDPEATGLPLSLCASGEAGDADRLPRTSKDAGAVSHHRQEVSEMK